MLQSELDGGVYFGSFTKKTNQPPFTHIFPRRIEWAKMYLHYYNAHKDEWMSAAAVPEKIQEVEVYQVHKPWIFNLATSVKRTYYENWSMRMLSLDGNDAGPDVIDTVKVRSLHCYSSTIRKLFFLGIISPEKLEAKT